MFKAKSAQELVSKAYKISKELSNEIDNLYYALDLEIEDKVKIDARRDHIFFLYEKLGKIVRKLYQLEFLDENRIENEYGFSFIVDKDRHRITEKFTKTELEINDDYIYLRLPEVMNKSDKSSSMFHRRIDNTIRDVIAFMIIEYEKHISKIKKIDEFTAIFVHHFTDNAFIKDTDNMSAKKVLDGLGFGILNNDSMKESHLIHLTKEDDNDFVELFIKPNHDISRYIFGTLPK